MTRFTKLYGAGPLHALGMLICFGFVGYVASRVLRASHPGWIAIWLAGAIVAHDLVLFPLYTAIDRLVLAHRRTRKAREPVVPWTNHLRVPVVICGILLLIWFPLVLGLSERTYAQATGLRTSVYLGRWLAVSACVFSASALAYAVRVFLGRRRGVSDGETQGS